LLGVVAFALCLTITSSQRETLITTTIVIVILTLVLLSGMLQKFANFLGLETTEEETELINVN
jgi:hypothetical protein